MAEIEGSCHQVQPQLILNHYRMAETVPLHRLAQIMGHKNPLRQQICEETNCLFKPIDSESCSHPHQYEFLEAPEKFLSDLKLPRFRFKKVFVCQQHNKLRMTREVDL
jgi:hypothetical protein